MYIRKSMKVLKERSRTYNGKNYYKYKINIPEVLLLNAKIRAGDEIEAELRPEGLLLKKINKK